MSHVVIKFAIRARDPGKNKAPKAALRASAVDDPENPTNTYIKYKGR